MTSRVYDKCFTINQRTLRDTVHDSYSSILADGVLHVPLDLDRKGSLFISIIGDYASLYEFLSYHRQQTVSLASRLETASLAL